MRLILASASVGRKELLSYLKIPFKVIPSTIDEEKIVGKTPLETIRLRARSKADDVFSLFKKPTTHNPSLTTIIILSADSGAIIDSKLIGKPKDYEDAVRILSTLSGRTHKFVTAVCLFSLSNLSDLGHLKVSTFHAVSRVTFRKLKKNNIKRYLSITNYKKYAGGYAISSSQDFIVKIEGSISNVIGLPMEKVIPYLRSASYGDDPYQSTDDSRKLPAGQFIPENKMRKDYE